MTINQYIADYLRQKLVDSPTLLVYDPNGRYHDLVPTLASDLVHVVDASKSFIKAREEAQRIYTVELPANEQARLVLYLALKSPTDNQARIKDPYFMFGLGGAIFPLTPADRYIELCKSCYPGQESKIDTLFVDSEPSFETVDALGAGNTYALLQTLTGGKSGGTRSDAEMVLAIMTGSPDMATAWKKQRGITAEWKTFAKQQLGLKASSGSALPDVQEEIWRYVLFSEFVYDLPVPLPVQFANVPRGGENQRKLILELGQTLRQRKGWEELYVENAGKVDEDLGLSEVFAQETDLGEIITFAFEDNTYFHRYINDILAGKLAEAAEEWSLVQGNIWEGHDPQRAANWQVARCGAELLHFAGTLTDEAIQSHETLAQLVEQYANHWYRFDQFQRSFEQYTDILPDRSELIETYIKRVRQTYRNRSELLQKRYQSLFVGEGWPGTIPFQNTSVWNKYIEPNLKAHVPTAYIWADALRFELGKEVGTALTKNGHIVDLIPSAAFIPTVTKLAMAALLPDADQKLYLRHVGESMEAELDGVVLKNLQDRVGVLRTRLGDRMQHHSLDNFLNSPKQKPFDLLCLSLTEIDTSGESLGSNALLPIQEAAKKLVRAVNKLKQVGYKQVIIAADHGFVLHPDYEPGDNMPKPPGDWWLAKKRCLAGIGTPGDASLGFTPERLSLRSDATQFIFARQFGVYQANTRYFHEGLSLQENIVPVLTVRLAVVKTESKADVTLSHKKGFITGLRPSIQVAAFSESLFAEPLIVRIEAVASGEVVGTLADQTGVNLLAGTVELTPGTTSSLTLEMGEDFEGNFDVVAINPATGKQYDTLSLRTDYSF
ncbi:PglZ domain-containing protein [Dyadobacter sandarakinus]|uniref:PglZ domain-containing protein n=1 Tax=Dyadobacter sandarakinus TaxID=2747268 RepID=A0ABX7I0F9_9BACT|nr:PglZ domain-containing protein [Dyadobacter sandarakinus]QRQ99505.1 PglZ domain-containing protein [Dyadobacter sandarakinus]